MVFPLPLVPFEEHMLLDDRPAYPMSIFARLRFTGRVDRATFEAAAAITLQRHPMFQAVVREVKPGQFEWVEWNGGDSVVRWLERPANGAYPHVPGIDLRRERGVRVWVSLMPSALAHSCWPCAMTACPAN